MDSNYQWQIQQANEKYRARQREAQLYRMSRPGKKENKEESPVSKSIMAAFLFIFFFIIGLITR